MSKNDALEYAKLLSEIGAEIISISNNLSNVQIENRTKAELQNLLVLYRDCATRYKNSYDKILYITPPEEIIELHDELLKAIYDFVEGTNFCGVSMTINANDGTIIAGKVDLQLYTQGLQKIKQGEVKTKLAAEKIISAFKKLGY